MGFWTELSPRMVNPTFTSSTDSPRCEKTHRFPRSDNDLQLVGGLEHQFYFPIYWVSNHPNWRTHIFQRGGPTTNQLCNLPESNRVFSRSLRVKPQNWRWDIPTFVAAMEIPEVGTTAPYVSHPKFSTSTSHALGGDSHIYIYILDYIGTHIGGWFL